jgi:hypothetical protein
LVIKEMETKSIAAAQEQVLGVRNTNHALVG